MTRCPDGEHSWTLEGRCVVCGVDARSSRFSDQLNGRQVVLEAELVAAWANLVHQLRELGDAFVASARESAARLESMRWRK